MNYVNPHKVRLGQVIDRLRHSNDPRDAALVRFADEVFSVLEGIDAAIDIGMENMTDFRNNYRGLRDMSDTILEAYAEGRLSDWQSAKLAFNNTLQHVAASLGEISIR